MKIKPVIIPPKATQPGTNIGLETTDARILDEESYGKSIWFVFSDGCVPPVDVTTRSCIRIIQIDFNEKKVFNDFDIASNGVIYSSQLLL